MKEHLKWVLDLCSLTPRIAKPCFVLDRPYMRKVTFNTRSLYYNKQKTITIMIKLSKNYLKKLSQLARMNESVKTSRKEECATEKLEQHSNERRKLGRLRKNNNKLLSKQRM